MAKLAYIEHPLFLKHNPGSGHPESPLRLSAIRDHLEKSGFITRITVKQSVSASMENLLRLHSKKYIETVLSHRNEEYCVLDTGDTVLSYHSVDAALLAAGAAELAVRLIFEEQFDKVFAAVRPPGHHAEAEKAMGFCVFNNIALAAVYAKAVYNISKVLIVDFDVHHGNGTQNSFYQSSDIFYLSLHRYPFYPGSGGKDERGSGKGEGYTLNLPLNSGSSDNDFIAALESALDNLEGYFHPELVLISAGFDAHIDDPLGGMRVSVEGFYKMTELIARFAQKHANGRIISFLEGGYNTKALAKSEYRHLQSLLKH